MDIHRSLKVVFCDFDGTLVDLPVDWASVRERLHSLLTTKNIQVRGGVSWANRYLSRYHRPLVRPWLNILESAERQAIPDSTVRTGAKAFLQYFAKDNIPVYITTSNGSRVVSQALRKHGLQQYVAAVAGREASLQGLRQLKPAPDTVIAVLHRLGLRARESIMIGNDQTDVRLAQRSHIPLYLTTRKKIPFPKTRVAPSLTALLPILKKKYA